MSQEARFKLKIEIEAVWATPREGLSLDDLAEKLRALGHTVLGIDREGNRVRVAHKKEN